MAATTNLSLRDLADNIAGALGVSKASAYEALGKTFESIVATAEKGGKVAVHGFGTFSKKVRKAKTGRNPQTGAAIKVPESSTLGFKPVPSLKKVKGKK